jgi:hypothetical protein
MNVVGLLKRHREVTKRLHTLGVRHTKFYVCASRPPKVGFHFKLAAKDTTQHFEKLDEIGRYFRKLRVKQLRVHANGVEFAVDVPWRESSIAWELVRAFKRFFYFWAVQEPFRIIQNEKERRALARKLKYQDIRFDGHRLIIDGLEGGAPAATISAALDTLYNEGSEEELKVLARILATAGRTSVAPSAQTSAPAAEPPAPPAKAPSPRKRRSAPSAPATKSRRSPSRRRAGTR